MSTIKKLEKEIKDNLFQLTRDELKTIVKHIQSIINRKNNMYTLEEIIKVWQEVYNEDMYKEYPAFINNLRRIKCVD